MHVSVMATKNQALENIKQLYDKHYAAEGQRIIEYHSDGAPELISRNIFMFLSSKQCRLGYSAAYTPEHNGLSERENRTIWESAHAMLIATCLPTSFWPYAVIQAVRIFNCLPTNTSMGDISPMQAKYNIIPDVSQFKVFGCIAFVHIDKAMRQKTLVDKAYKGFYIGTPDKPNDDRYLMNSTIY